MAWVELDSTTLYDSGVAVGYVKFEYDNSSTGVSRPCRVRIEERSGYYFTVYFDNFYVNGDKKWDRESKNQNSGTIWSGNLQGYSTVSWSCPWYSGTTNYNLDGTVPSSAAAPSGAHATFVSHTWNSVTMTSSVSSWGSGYSGTPNLETIVDADTTSSFGPRIGIKGGTTATSVTRTVSNATANLSFEGGVNLIGCTRYRIACWASTSVGHDSYLASTTRYTPPAPGILSQDSTTALSVTTTYTADVANNQTTYDSADLTWTYRYKIDNGAWAYENNASVLPMNTTLTYTVAVPDDGNAHHVDIEAWMAYHGNQSEVSTMTFDTVAAAAKLYGSVNDESVQIKTLYGSVNGESVKLKKLYGSVAGKSKLIFKDNS